MAGWCNFEFVDERFALELCVVPADGLARANRTVKNPMTVSGFGLDAFLHRNP